LQPEVPSLGTSRFFGLSAGFVLLAALATVSPAGADPPPDVGWQEPVAGTRLVPVFLTAEDESRQFVGWFDRLRGEDCAFELAADGQVRCLPSEAIEATVFADATCKTRMASACSSARYVIERESACGDRPRFHVFAPGRRFRPTSAFAQTEHGCSRVAPDDAGVYVAVGDEVPPALFVAARPSTGRSVLGLKRTYER